MLEENNQDALARVIDPNVWALYDQKDVARKMNPVLREQIVEDSRKAARRVIESGLMASFDWDRAEYSKALKNIKEDTSRRGYCYSVEDGLDGSFMHDPRCVYWPSGATGGSGCLNH